MDPALAKWENEAALEQARQRFPDDPRRIETLKDIISAPDKSVDFRARAFEHLYEHDAEVAKDVLKYRLPTHRSWSFVQWASETIAQRGWVEMTPALVRSLYRPSPNFDEEHRPERQALLNLHPDKDLREIVCDVVLEPPADVVEAQWRLAAWELLNRLGPADPWAPRLAGTQTNDPFLRTLRDGYTQLGIIARNREQIQWLETLANTDNARLRERMAQAVQQLDPAHRIGLELRHLPVLLAVGDYHPEWLDLTDRQIMARLDERITGREHYHPDITLGARTGDSGPQSWSHWRSTLTWLDLLTVLLIDHIVADTGVQSQLLTQARKDHADESTEYGGLLTIQSGGQPQATLYEPIHRSHDQKFYTPQNMITDGYRAVSHYHFHVQEERNHDYAGPGSGDAHYADAVAVNAVVFTYVGDDRLNADFYTQNDIIIDLGSFPVR